MVNLRLKNIERRNLINKKLNGGILLDLQETKDSQINLVVNQPSSDEITIDLGNVFHNMKTLSRIYAWVLILCVVIGACVPLLMYQVQKKPLTVYSVVKLDYTLEDEKTVADLTAPDGEELDLNQITSSYVLQQALDRIELSQPVSLSNLRSNISIQRILTEDSMRQQEILSAMMENNNSGAYEQMANIKRNYINTFIVSLVNGFGDEDARVKVELEDDELSLLLDNILIAYNDYLAKTYADVNLPGDDISVIDIEELDIPEGVDQLRTALRNLYTYCDEKPDYIKAYRSRETGNSLNDLMQNIQLIQTVDVEYLSSYVYANGIARDREEVIDNHRYNLLVAQTELDEINENIAAVTTLLDNYKNDEILISVPESDSMQTAVTNTTYYNDLIQQQAENEKLAAEKEEEITEIQSRIAALVSAEGNVTAAETMEAEEELGRLAEKCREINTQLRNHMEEIFNSSFYNTMAEHSAPLGNQESFVKAIGKKFVIGIAAGAVIGIAIWGVAALIPEFTKGRKKEEVPDTASLDDKASDQDNTTGSEVAAK